MRDEKQFILLHTLLGALLVFLQHSQELHQTAGLRLHTQSKSESELEK